MALQYFDSEHAISVHDEIIKKSGGTLGVLSIGLLESVLEHIQNDFYYETLEQKLTHLFFSINKNHCFADGNKRRQLLYLLISLKLIIVVLL